MNAETTPTIVTKMQVAVIHEAVSTAPATLDLQEMESPVHVSYIITFQGELLRR